ncbi:hypothetical protein CGRA01v4_10159 [Colletotrichum graminicola]|nr:hypothetical protein CGRA01v4_10159 [Colletotrichum graminicola]
MEQICSPSHVSSAEGRRRLSVNGGSLGTRVVE